MGRGGSGLGPPGAGAGSAPLCVSGSLRCSAAGAGAAPLTSAAARSGSGQGSAGTAAELRQGRRLCPGAGSAGGSGRETSPTSRRVAPFIPRWGGG